MLDKAPLLPRSKLSFIHWEKKKKKLGKKLANKPDVTISRQLCFTVWHLGPTVIIQGGGEMKSRTFLAGYRLKDSKWLMVKMEAKRAASLILNKGDPWTKTCSEHCLLV